MFAQNPNGILNTRRLFYLWMIILGLVLITAVIVGVQVYWWQRAVARAEQKELVAKINKLENEIRLLQQRAQLQSAPVSPKDLDYRKLLAGREQKVIMALKQRDMDALATLVHPEKGVRFSPYVFINPDSDVVFSAERIRSFFQDRTERIWGYYEDTATPLKLTNEAYFKSYVYDDNYAFADKINYNREIKGSLTAGNVFEIYPRTIVIEYLCSKSGNPDDASAWRDLKLVFAAEGKVWYLVGIVHDQWTI
jgi:hypothetical protein